MPKLPRLPWSRQRTDLKKFWLMNESLEGAGFPELSPWWRNTIGAAYEAMVPAIGVRGGRRGGKSTSLCRVAVFETLHGEHDVPLGDTGWFAIISAERGQAKERLRTCGQILTALGVEHKETADRIVITDGRPEFEKACRRGIRTFTASLSGVVSFTCIGALCDEEARWRDEDSGANPASAVLSSLTPTTASMPNAMVWHVSSPWSTLDAHHAMIERGNTRNQRVFIGTTWEMNPTISEARTRELEPDEISWLREYAAMPMASDETKFFNAAAIEMCVKMNRTYTAPLRTVAGGDFAFRRDASAVVVVEQHTVKERNARTNTTIASPHYRLVYENEITAKGGAPLKPSVTISEHMGQAEAHGADTVACDLHYIETVRETIDDNGFDISLAEFPTKNEDIVKAYVHLRVLINSGQYDLSQASPRLVDQLKNTTSTPGDGAQLFIKNKRTVGSHGDSVSALVCATWAGTRTPIDDDVTGAPRRFSRPSDAPKAKWHDRAEQWNED